MRPRIAVLASGGGTNLAALIDAARAGRLRGQIALVASDRPGCGALQRAADAGLPYQVVDRSRFARRADFDAAMAETLAAHRIDLIVLAGFMRVLSPPFVARFPGRILNTHPSLLPAFRGKDAPAQALAAGVKLTGCTIHFVDEGVDTGPIVAQEAVRVEPGDTPDALADRIRAVEHVLYPRVVDAVAAGEIRLEGGRVVVERPLAPASEG